MFRRLLSSSARAATDLATSGSQSSSVASSVRTVDARLLPPALQNHIMREVDKQVAQANMYIRNPFVVHTFTCNVVGRADLSAAQKSHRVHHPPAFSPRRQKQLLQMYPAEHLPPSTLNPVESLPVELPDGTVVHWVGKWSSKKEKNVYKSVARMFKGTIAERKEAQTLKDREERLATMERRIAEWKKNKLEAKAGKKSSLPF